MIQKQIDAILGVDGDYPIKGTAKVTAPNDYYFSGVTVISDATMTAMETVGAVNYTGDSYLNKVLPVTYHPFTAKVTAITLSAGEMQAWLKKIS